MTPLEAALAWHDAGFCTIPPAQDGKKRPAFEWKQWQSERPRRSLVEGWYSLEGFERTGVGIVCGAVSGNLEMLELEGCATSSLDFDAILWECQARGIDWLWETLLRDGYAEWTPSGGLHFFYRVDGAPVPGNKKVAQRLATGEELAENPGQKRFTLAETRGEGGWVIVAPSHGNIHPTKQSWTFAAGEPGRVLTITQQQRDLLCESLHAALDKMPEVQRYEPPVRPALSSIGSQLRPGDDYAARMDWADILEPLGYRLTKQSGFYREWERPGKNQGSCSVTTGKTAEDRLYCFSSNDPYFEPDAGPYNKFAAYVQINFGHISAQNLHEATKRLASDGYGTPRDVDSDSRLVFASVKTAERPTVAAQTASDPAPVEQVPLELDSLGMPLYPDTVFGQEPWDQVGAARIWTSIFKDTFTHSSTQKTWSQWSQSAWREDEQEHHGHSASLMVERIRNYARQAEAADPEGSKNLARKAEKLCTNGAIEAILKIAAKDPRIAVKPSDFDKDPNLMTVGNGTLNLQTGQLGPHDPKNMLTRLVNADFRPEAETGRWNQFMEQILPDPQVRNYLQRACGYMLTGTLNERVMFLIHGESGTGKTQFLEALRAVLGDFAGVAPASAFQPRQQGYKGPSEDLHKLKGKRLVIQSELDAGSKLNESLVKSIIGGDTQTTRPLYGAPVDWEPEYTVFMATNYLPRISSSDNAIWNRVKPIKFEQVFIDDSGQALDPSSRNLGRKMAKEEPEVILNWLLEGLRMYQEQGLKEPAQVLAWTQGYRDDVDTTRQFIAEAPEEGRIKVEENASVTVRDLYRTYAAWCQDNGITPVGSKTFNERMLSSGWKKEKRERGITWLGIGLAGWIGEALQPAVVKTWERRQ